MFITSDGVRLFTDFTILIFDFWRNVGNTEKLHIVVVYLSNVNKHKISKG